MITHLTAQEVCALLKLRHPSTVCRYIKRGWLRGRKIGRRYLIDPVSVQALLAPV
ncbi:MAG: helix-turn-helix domain-containing protein [Planctomycetota bacterium]